MVRLTTKEKAAVADIIYDFGRLANEKGYDAGGFSIVNNDSDDRDYIMLEWRAYTKMRYPALKRKHLTLDDALAILKKHKIHRSILFYNARKTPEFSIEIKSASKNKN